MTSATIALQDGQQGERIFSSRSARLVAGVLVGAIVASVVTQKLQTKDNKGKRRRSRSLRSGEVHSGASESSDRGTHGEDDHPEPRASVVRPGVVRGVAGLIGNTPLMRIESLSELTGCEILGKAEFLNPAGSPKDRVALQILLDAEAAGLLKPHRGDCVFEGTVGSTGISLATLCRAKGYRCSIVLPDDVASEKSALLEKLGAQVKKVRPRGIVDPRHFVNEARALAQTFGNHDAPATSNGEPRGFFADQFETSSNFLAHYTGTGPEIWAQCGGSTELMKDGEYAETSTSVLHAPQLDAFVAGAGTGGTLSGVAAALREREATMNDLVRLKRSQPRSGWFLRCRQWLSGKSYSEESPVQAGPIKIVLADPFGSGLFNKVHHGVMYSSTEAEGTRRRHQVDTIVEGIGMNRITRNLAAGVDLVDDAVRVQDEEAVRMSRWLSVRDGLFVGSSSCVNVIAAVKTAVQLKREWKAEGRKGRPTVVTILCDSGVRHLSKFHNDEVLERDYGITLPEDAMDVDISDMLN